MHSSPWHSGWLAHYEGSANIRFYHQTQMKLLTSSVARNQLLWPYWQRYCTPGLKSLCFLLGGTYYNITKCNKMFYG